MRKSIVWIGSVAFVISLLTALLAASDGQTLLVVMMLINMATSGSVVANRLLQRD